MLARMWMLALLAMLAAPSPHALAIGDTLPALSGTSLDGRALTLPGAAAGRVTLIAVGFSEGSRLAVQAWVHRFLADFGGNPAVACYEVRMMGRLKALSRPFTDGGMSRGIAPEDRGRVIPHYGGTADWKRRLGFEREGDAYLVVLDKRGRVALLHHGPFLDANYENLAAVVQRLRG
jgi:hypothetical protein